MFAEVQIASLFAIPLRMLGSARLRQPRSHGQVPESLRSGIRRVQCRVVIGSFRRRRPATVLCHSHDEKLWNIQQMRIKGRLERRADQWVFISTDFRRPPRSQLTLFWGFIPRHAQCRETLPRRAWPGNANGQLESPSGASSQHFSKYE
jgi:hypothetical protein